MADKVLTMAGANLGEVTATPAVDPAKALEPVVAGWTWRHIVAVVGGSFAIVGGGSLAYYGWTRDRKGYKWGGLILAGAGVVTIGVAILLAYLRKQAIAKGLVTAGYGTTPADSYVDPDRVAARGDLVALVDGRRGKVNAIRTSLDGSQTYDLRLVDQGYLTPDEVFVKGEQLAGVIVARG